MTTWKEAFTLFRVERDEAIKLKEVRDEIVWAIKRPRVEDTRRTHKLYKEILRYLQFKKRSNKLQQKKITV